MPRSATRPKTSPPQIAARRTRDGAARATSPSFTASTRLSRAFELALHDAGMPYQLVHGVEFFQRKEIKDILAYLQLLNNPRDASALRRVINTPPRGIGKTTVDRLSDFALRQGLWLLDAARHARLDRVASGRGRWLP